MDFNDVVKKRRSVRKYKSTPVSDDFVEKILEAARLAPSGHNYQPCHFIVVKDSERKKSLGLRDWAAEAPIIIVGCTDSILSPTWHMVDFGIAFEHIVLAATNLGLATCWQWKLDNETIKKALNIPESMKLVAITTLGYAAEEPESKTRKPLSEMVHKETFQ